MGSGRDASIPRFPEQVLSVHLSFLPSQDPCFPQSRGRAPQLTLPEHSVVWPQGRGTARWGSPGSVRLETFHFVMTSLSRGWWGGCGAGTPSQSPPRLSLPLWRRDCNQVSRISGHKPRMPTPAHFSGGQWMGMDRCPWFHLRTHLFCWLHCSAAVAMAPVPSTF